MRNRPGIANNQADDIPSSPLDALRALRLRCVIQRELRNGTAAWGAYILESSPDALPRATEVIGGFMNTSYRA